MKDIFLAWREVMRKRSLRFKELCEIEDMFYGDHSSSRISKDLKTVNLPIELFLILEREESKC